MLSLPSDATFKIPDKSGSLGDLLDGNNYHCSSAPLEQSTEIIKQPDLHLYPSLSLLFTEKLVHRRMTISVSLFLENGEVENTKVVPIA